MESISSSVIVAAGGGVKFVLGLLKLALLDVWLAAAFLPRQALNRAIDIIANSLITLLPPESTTAMLIDLLLLQGWERRERYLREFVFDCKIELVDLLFWALESNFGPEAVVDAMGLLLGEALEVNWSFGVVACSIVVIIVMEILRRWALRFIKFTVWFVKRAIYVTVYVSLAIVATAYVCAFALDMVQDNAAQ